MMECTSDAKLSSSASCKFRSPGKRCNFDTVLCRSHNVILLFRMLTDEKAMNEEVEGYIPDARNPKNAVGSLFPYPK
jgi:hypothetical protein